MRLFLGVLLILLAMLLSRYSRWEGDSVIQKEYLLMDTFVSVQIYSHPPESSRKILEAIEPMMKKMENQFTCHLSEESVDSEVIQWNENKKGVYPISKELAFIISLSDKIYQSFDSAFDITLKPIKDLWDIGGKKQRIPSEKEISETLVHCGWKTSFLKNNTNSYSLEKADDLMQIDLGGVAKGYIVDSVALYLKNNGVTSAIINAGGDITLIGEKSTGMPFRIGVKHPTKEGLFRILELTDCSIATSGIYERFFMEKGIRYHHIMNPQTGYPVDNKIISVTVLAPSSILADSLATSLSVKGLEEGLKLLPEFEKENSMKLGVMFIDDKGKAYYYGLIKPE